MRQADLILHAGDVCTPQVLDELAQFAPVRVAMGNNDGAGVRAWGALDRLTLELAGLSVAMLHDSGQAAGRGARMRRAFPHADLLVFGHSHIPVDVVEDGLQVFNPGSPTDKRRQPCGSYGELVIEDARLISSRLIAL